MHAPSSSPLPLPAPEIDERNRPHWEGLKQGELRFQRCGACGHAWLPAREQCPRCLSSQVDWEVASGRARLVSWVTYHVAFNKAFADRIPYIVAIVTLAEGPRMLTNIVDVASEDELVIEMPLVLTIEWEDKTAVAHFRPERPGEEHRA
jgi:uncharacterized OB-fold protein